MAVGVMTVVLGAGVKMPDTAATVAALVAPAVSAAARAVVCASWATAMDVLAADAASAATSDALHTWSAMD